MEIKDSDRLSYALMGEKDADLLFQLDQDVEVMRYINGGKMTSMKEVQEVFLPRMAKYTDATKGWGLWKITHKGSEEFIGWILVRPMDFFSDMPQLNNIELGWRFKQNAWGKGYGSESAKHIKEILSESGQIEKFTAIVLPENQGSIGIMKKLGMCYVKTELHKDPLGDEVLDYYEVLALN